MRLMNTVFPDAKLDNAVLRSFPHPMRNYMVRPQHAYGTINSMNENAKLYKCKKFIKITF